MKTNFLKKALVVMLAMVLAIPAFLSVEAQAEEKTYLRFDDAWESADGKGMTIGIGSYGMNSGYYHKKKTRYALSVENSKKGATYTFKSGNEKVVKVKKSGTVGYITGIKAGTTTITVEQKLKGKTTTVGKCKVTVKAAKVRLSEVYESFGVGEKIFVGGVEQDPICIIDNYNPKATYTYKCKDKNFKMSHVEYEALLIGEGYFGYTQEYTAKKAGTYTVTVEESYNKKTKSIGKIKVKVKNIEVKEKETFAQGDSADPIYSLTKYSDFIPLFVEWEETDVVKKAEPFPWEEESSRVEFVKAGTVKFKFYYKKQNGKKGKLIGTSKVTVVEVVPTDIEVVSSLKTYVGDYESNYINYDIKTNVEDAYYRGEVSFKSSDEFVIEVSDNGSFEAKAPGTATITITAGDVKKEVAVTVLSYDEYWGE